MTQENQTNEPAKKPTRKAKTATKSKTASKRKSTTKKAATKKATRKSASAKKTAAKKPVAIEKVIPAEEATSRSAPNGHSTMRAEKPAQNGADSTPSNSQPDYAAFASVTSEIAEKSQEILREYAAKNPAQELMNSEATLDPLNINECVQEVMKGLASDPGTVMQRQINLWGDYAKLMTSMSRRMAGEDIKPAFSPEPGDKRFRHKAWEENPMLDFIKQSYLMASNWLETTVSNVEGMDEREKARAEFYTRQLTDAFSPTNFAALNPEVVETTIESKGENILKGLRNFLEDIERGDGKLDIRQTDLEHFVLGKNIATTPGKVVFQNDIIQLIQYEPTTEKVSEIPMLIVPPWINKFYILDLQESNSFVKWLVDQGRTVFIVSWVNPTESHREKVFEDYIREGLFAALDAVKAATGSEKSDVIGYCIGGTMLSMALSYMAQTNDNRINSATFFTAQADFSEAGDLLFFVDDSQLDSMEKQMDAAGGYLEGRSMATTFNMLRSNDLIWSFFINNYMMGKDPTKFDLLFWNADATRMPKNVHLFYLRDFYQHNRLAKGEMVMDNVKLDLSAVNIPIFMQAGETDHIAPHNSVYKTAKLFASGDNDDVTYMLAGSGHIAGVVNHPDKKKYHYSTNDLLPDTIEAWKKDAERTPGSWWPHWLTWLDEVSTGEVDARIPGDGKLDIIEDAPGSFVKVRS